MIGVSTRLWQAALGGSALVVFGALLPLPFGPSALLAPLLATAAHAEDLPIIMSYEREKRLASAQSADQQPQLFWTGQLMTKIEAQRRPQAHRLPDMRTAQVGFTVARDGHLVEEHIVRGSGTAELDTEALGMVKRAEPFPAMPSKLTDAELSFVLPVRFR